MAEDLGITVLLLEDDDRVGPPFRDYLADQGFNVLFATSVEEAAAIIDESGFIDCAVIDKGAAGESGLIGHRGGLGVVADLREKFERCRIIIYSGEGSVTSELLESGANFFMWKPMELSVIVDELAHGALAEEEVGRECLPLLRTGRGTWREVRGY